MGFDFKAEYKQGRELSSEQLNKVVLLKMQHWDYSKESHLTWIRENVNDNEFHLLIHKSEEMLAAYLNIVNVPVFLDSFQSKVLGIGNVCVDKRFAGKGYGLLLMDIANFIIKQLGKPGILLCRENLVNFYEKVGWNQYHGDVLLINKPYSGAVLFTNKTVAKSLKVEKNF